MEKFVRQCGNDWVYCDSDCGRCSDSWSRALASTSTGQFKDGMIMDVQIAYTENFPKKSVRPLTNADKIRNMSDEELAHLFVEDYWGCFECPEYPKQDFENLDCTEKCKEHCLEWLRKEVC